MACAPPISKHVRDAQQPRRAENLRSPAAATPRRCSARPPPAPESPSSSAWRAADSGPPGMYAATVSSGRTICPSRSPGCISAIHSARHLQSRRTRGCWPPPSPPRARNSGASLPQAARSSASGTRTLLRSSPSNLRAYSSSALSPRLRTASRIGRTTASASVKPRRLARQQAADLFAVGRIRHHITILFSGYSTIPCAARLLQPRNDVAHRGSRPESYSPPAIPRRSGAKWSAASAPAARPAPPPDCPCARSASARLCPAR